LSVLGLFAYVGLRLQPSLQVIVGGLNAVEYSAVPLQDIHDDLVTKDRVRRPWKPATVLPSTSALTLEHVTFPLRAGRP
jgi:ATP-binding cassette, subfamily B, bacterial PglK